MPKSILSVGNQWQEQTLLLRKKRSTEHAAFSLDPSVFVACYSVHPYGWPKHLTSILNRITEITDVCYHNQLKVSSEDSNLGPSPSCSKPLSSYFYIMMKFHGKKQLKEIWAYCSRVHCGGEAQQQTEGMAAGAGS